MKEAGTGKQEAGGADTLQGFRRLIAWQKADDLAVAVYSTLRRASQLDPWLRSQANRAAFSVAANIAEGYGRGSLGDYLHFLDFARGSLAELDYALHFAGRLDLIPVSDSTDLEKRLRETGRVLQGLWRSLKQKSGTDWNHTSVRDERVLYDIGEDPDEDV